jgi:hypothetical protein
MALKGNRMVATRDSKLRKEGEVEPAAEAPGQPPLTKEPVTHVQT